MKKHYKKAIQYVKEHRNWSDACEEYALETIDTYRCPIEQASSEIEYCIRELMNDYTSDNDLPDGWWCEFGSDIFFETLK